MFMLLRNAPRLVSAKENLVADKDGQRLARPGEVAWNGKELMQLHNIAGPKQPDRFDWRQIDNIGFVVLDPKAPVEILPGRGW